jgi:hypothetical protein
MITLICPSSLGCIHFFLRALVNWERWRRGQQWHYWRIGLKGNLLCFLISQDNLVPISELLHFLGQLYDL